MLARQKADEIFLLPHFLVSGFGSTEAVVTTLSSGFVFPQSGSSSINYTFFWIWFDRSSSNYTFFWIRFTRSSSNYTFFWICCTTGIDIVTCLLCLRLDLIYQEEQCIRLDLIYQKGQCLCLDLIRFTRNDYYVFGGFDLPIRMTIMPSSGFSIPGGTMPSSGFSIPGGTMPFVWIHYCI